MSDHEYRVRWQREGRAIASRIYQTEDAARRKIDGILALEEAKADTTRWADLPDLTGPPTLQVRDVSSWRDATPAAQIHPSDTAREGIKHWVGIHDDAAAWPL